MAIGDGSDAPMSEQILPTRLLRAGSAETGPASDSGSRRFRFALAAVAVLVFLGGVGYWTQHAVREYLHESLADDLEARVEARAAALLLWARSERDEARLWAESTLVRDAVTELLAPAGLSCEPSAAVHDRLRELLSPELRERDSVGFVVVDPAGQILAASSEAVIGRRMAAPGRAVLADALQGRTALSGPVHASSDLGLDNDARGAVMAAAASVRDSAGHDLAVLMFLLDPQADFSQIVTAGSHGESDAYAFNADGLMVSETQHLQQLRDLELVPPTPDPTSILNVTLREPGYGLTRAVAAAVAGQSGVDVRGYRNYRGTRVAGAWRWLPELDLGIATEVPIRRAFGALRPLRLAFGGLFTLLVLATAAAFSITHRAGQLHRRVRAIQRVGQYTLEEKIGEGGMGIVYRARHALLRRPTAVKLLKGTEATPEAVARFEQEVQLTSQLSHPNTVEIYDFGRTAEGVFYYAMELLPGLDLARLIELDGPQSAARVIHILRQVCAALSEAHAAGLIHRDIKPLNIILGQRGGVADFATVLDFGLVKQVDAATPRVTVAEAVHGTPLYIPPERLRDPRHADARTDIYAVGGVAFNLLTAQDPYRGRTTMELCFQVLNSQPPRASSLAPHPIPPQLDALVEVCLAKDPDHRPPDIDTMMNTLDKLATRLPWTQEQARRWWSAHSARTAGNLQVID